MKNRYEDKLGNRDKAEREEGGKRDEGMAIKLYEKDGRRL